MLHCLILLLKLIATTASFVSIIAIAPSTFTLRLVRAACRFDDVHGTDASGKPVTSVPSAVLESIKRNHVCLKGTLYTPLSKTTATESLNVQLRKALDSHVNLVHGFSLKGLPTRHENIDIVVIR